MSENEAQDEVGYGQPPKSGQFKKGQSGNQKGRPKGSKNLATIVLRESRQPVRVNGPRGSRSVTKLEATVMQLGNKAAQGDIRSQREFISLVRVSEEAANSDGSKLTPHEMDQKVMQSILRRLQETGSTTAFTATELGREESR